MHAVLFHAPDYGITVPAFGAMLAVAVLLTFWLVPRSVESIVGIERGRARYALLFVALAALVGGRLHFIANFPYVFAGRWPEALNPWFGGFHVGGGFVFGFLALVVAARRMGVPFGRLADGMLPPAGISVAVGRIGCFLQGCCIGAPCNLPWGVSYPPGSRVYEAQIGLGMIAPGAERSTVLHPLQLYFSAAALLASLAMYSVARRPRRYDGEVALIGFFLFWASTALLETLRAPWAATPLWGPFRQLHWTALVLTALCFLALVAAESAHYLRTARDGRARA
jgi:phosphatidylglycerol---prolipoprotein diacylglyceryl transferase